MRTVVFFGLMSIAESIGAQTGWVMTERVIKLGAAIFIVAMLMDILSFIRSMFNVKKEEL